MPDLYNLTPEQVAEVIGSVVQQALIQSAGSLKMMRIVHQALRDHDVEKAESTIQNYLSVYDSGDFDAGVLVNLAEALNGSSTKRG